MANLKLFCLRLDFIFQFLCSAFSVFFPLSQSTFSTSTCCSFVFNVPFFISIRTCSHTQYKRSIILLANRKKITSFHLRFVFRLCFALFQQLHSKTYTQKNSIEIIIFNEQFLGFFMNSFCDSKKWLLFNKVICLVNYRPIFFLALCGHKLHLDYRNWIFKGNILSYSVDWLHEIARLFFLRNRRFFGANCVRAKSCLCFVWIKTSEKKGNTTISNKSPIY